MEDPPSGTGDAGTASHEVDWAARAAVAERAVTGRHLRRLGGVIPRTRIGRVRWPRRAPARPWPWHYWWQAHLLDCLVDAQLRAPRPKRADAIAAVARTVRLRNLGRWTNDYYDDVAWFGLAVQRAGTLARRSARPALGAVVLQLRDGWTADAGGGIWWRRGDDFKNAPANGPAAILLARGGNVGLAASIVDWMHDTLRDPATGLIRDGVRVDRDGSVRAIEGNTYTYCQGVHLGACVALAEVDDTAERQRWADRAAELLDAVATHVVGLGRCHPRLRRRRRRGAVQRHPRSLPGRCRAAPARARTRRDPGRPRERCSGLAGPGGTGGRSGVRPGLATPGSISRFRPGGGGPVGAALRVDGAGGRRRGPARRLTLDQVSDGPASRCAGSGAGGCGRKASSGWGASSSIGRRIS